MQLWLNVDPLAEKYPSLSPYVYVADNPVNAIDPDGRDIIFVTNKGAQLQYRKGNFYYLNGDLKGQKYDGRKHSTGSASLYRLAKAYRKIENSNDKVLKGILHQLENSENVHQIQDGTAGRGSKVYKNRNGSAKDYEGDGSVTYYDFSQESKKSFEERTGIKNSDLSIVTHEMSHQLDEDMGNTSDDQYPNTASDPSEIRAVNIENRGRKLDKLPSRTKYGGDKIDPKKLENPPNQKLPK